MKSVKSKNILVIGDIMLDKYISCETNKISQEAPIPVLRYKETRIVLGGAANVANNLAANGQKVILLGVIGEDTNGSALLNVLQESHISSELIVADKNRLTTTKTRYVSMGQQIFRYDEENTTNISDEIERSCINAVNKVVGDIDIVVISDYLKGFLTNRLTQEIIKIANENNIPVIVDPKDRNELKYKHCTLIKPNKKEMEEFLGGKQIDESNVENEARELKEKIGCRYVLLTLGAKGMLFIDENNEEHYIESQAKEVYDVTGAGDTVLSFVAMGFEGMSLNFSKIEIANRAAAIKVSKFGTSVVKYDELFKNSLNEKIFELKAIVEITKKCKKDGQEIVFTNGCFDILHAGHVKYLQEAKELGDVLILGLNSDLSVKKLKGPERPIVSEQERAAVLEGLSAVDYVVLFDDETPIELIKAIKPDILAKGGDYVIEDIVGYEEVTANGGEVVTLPFVEGKSTTNIVEKIKAL